MGYNSSYTGAQTDTYVTKTQLVNLIYPVGSIYISVSSIEPAVLFGGTWTALQGRFLIGCSSGAFANGVKGGADESALTASSVPLHTHEIVDFAASDTIDNYCFITLQSDGNLVNYKGIAGTSNIAAVWSSGTHGASSGTFRPFVLGSDSALPGTGGGTTTYHNNMPPFIWVNMWKRTA